MTFLIYFMILVIYMQSSFLKIIRNIARVSQTFGKDNPIFFGINVNACLDP